MEKIYGYNGKIAFIDLNKEQTEIKDFDPIIAENYIGGVGLAAKLTYDLLSDADYRSLKINPFSELNPLIFATGPLTASITPSSSRYAVTCISPLTGIWAEATSGGYFPTALRRSGFDAIVITGESSTPKYIFVNNGNIEFRSAENLWGKDSYESQDLIKKALNDDKLRIACIGKAGENLVRYAAIMNDEGRAAGRCGVGAIMGAKKLKAIAIKGSNTIEYADKALMKKTADNVYSALNASFAPQMFRQYGTLIYTDMAIVLGDIPGYYFSENEFIVERLTGRYLKELYPVFNYGCAGCTIQCGRTTHFEENGEVTIVDGPEYETTGTFGPMCGILDFDPIIKANHICNLEGVDTISSGVCISFLIYLVENRIGLEAIEKHISDVKIEDIKWGNAEIVLNLLKNIIRRKGIGDLLAEGVKVMAEKLGIDPELAAHVKGLEIPMHDPRAYLGQALSYMTCCTGANHNRGDFFNIDGDTCLIKGIRKGDRFNITKRERDVIRMQDICSIYDSATICNFTHINLPFLTKLFQGSTGIPSLGNQNKLMEVGERTNTLKRLISCKLGTTRKDDYFPNIVKKIFKVGGSQGADLETLEDNLKTYYEIRGWEWDTGFPSEEKLRDLNII